MLQVHISTLQQLRLGWRQFSGVEILTVVAMAFAVAMMRYYNIDHDMRATLTSLYLLSISISMIVMVAASSLFQDRTQMQHQSFHGMTATAIYLGHRHLSSVRTICYSTLFTVAFHGFYIALSRAHHGDNFRLKDAVSPAHLRYHVVATFFLSYAWLCCSVIED